MGRVFESPRARSPFYPRKCNFTREFVRLSDFICCELMALTECRLIARLTHRRIANAILLTVPFDCNSDVV